MNQFFTIFTYTPWDKLGSIELTKVRLLSIMEIFKKYPVIEVDFFDDLKSNINNNPHYDNINTIKRITGPKSEDYSIQNWIFIWAMDYEKRIYQFLFQKTKRDNEIQGILVALAPPELVQLCSKYKKVAILKTLSLLNKPDEIKFLKFLTAKGKSILEEKQLFQLDEKDLKQIKQINHLKNQPNIDGQWFPNFSPKCPICNGLLTELGEYKVGFGKLICPRCGYKN